MKRIIILMSCLLVVVSSVAQEKENLNSVRAYAMQFDEWKAWTQETMQTYNTQCTDVSRLSSCLSKLGALPSDVAFINMVLEQHKIKSLPAFQYLRGSTWRLSSPHPVEFSFNAQGSAAYTINGVAHVTSRTLPIEQRYQYIVEMLKNSKKTALFWPSLFNSAYAATTPTPVDVTGEIAIAAISVMLAEIIHNLRYMVWENETRRKAITEFLSTEALMTCQSMQHRLKTAPSDPQKALEVVEKTLGVFTEIYNRLKNEHPYLMKQADKNIREFISSTLKSGQKIKAKKIEKSDDLIKSLNKEFEHECIKDLKKDICVALRELNKCMKDYLVLAKTLATPLGRDISFALYKQLPPAWNVPLIDPATLEVMPIIHNPTLTPKQR